MEINQCKVFRMTSKSRGRHYKVGIGIHYNVMTVHKKWWAKMQLEDNTWISKEKVKKLSKNITAYFVFNLILGNIQHSVTCENGSFSRKVWNSEKWKLSFYREQTKFSSFMRENNVPSFNERQGIHGISLAYWEDSIMSTHLGKSIALKRCHKSSKQTAQCCELLPHVFLDLLFLGSWCKWEFMELK